MAVDFPRTAKNTLRKAFERGRLTLYLGAGVSVPSGLPTWQRLVMIMYFEMLRQGNRRAYSNYVHATADWMLAKSPEPLEITAQKIRAHYGTDVGRFMRSMKQQLYVFYATGSTYHVPDRATLRGANLTLDAVARLCEHSSIYAGRGVESVITYNYDDLLEIALRRRPRHQVIDSTDVERDHRALPIYHVHGYLPMRPGEVATQPEGIIFTEERYHEATHAAYSWSNLVQLRGLAASTGLMVGLSLSDRNVRRLMHALSSSPVAATCYAVLQRPTWRQPHDHEVYEVEQLAQRLYQAAADSGAPMPVGYGVKGSDWEAEIRGILNYAQSVATDKHEHVLRDLGVRPIWYDHHGEVPDILDQILA